MKCDPQMGHKKEARSFCFEYWSLSVERTRNLTRHFMHGAR
jgi:hypothetical protein